MKFVYGYKTKGNETREGCISAPSRDAVYALLKKDGIRPFSVRLAPGFFNRLQSFGKRWLAIVLLFGVASALLVYLLLEKEVPSPIENTIESTMRRQPIGDAAIIEKGIRSGWDFAFPDMGERFLASFAIPGVPAGVKSVDAKILLSSLSKKTGATPEDGIEVRQIKSMVEGMKDEMRRFIAAGGSPQQYGKLLVERQEQEIGYYTRAKVELDRLANSGASEEEIERLWEKRNEELRQMGIRLISMPGEGGKNF